MASLLRSGADVSPITKGDSKPCKGAMKAMAAYKHAVEELAFMGTMRPETWPSIQQAYKDAQEKLERYLVRVEPRK